MLRNVVAAMGVGLLMAGLPPGVQAEEVLKLGHVGGTGSAFSAAAQSFAAEVSKATNGRYRVEEYGNSVLGDEGSMLEAVKLGTLSLIISGPLGPLSKVVPEVSVLGLPFLFRDEAHAVKVLDGPIGQSLLDVMRSHGFQGLAWAENGFRQLTTNNIPVRKPEDVRALTIRVNKGSIAPRIWQALGAAEVVELNINEVYGALKSGRINAQENPILTSWSYNFFDFQNTVITINYVYSPLVLVMNSDDYDELSPEMRQVFVKAARVAGQTSRDLVAQQNLELTARLKEKGTVFITDPDLAAFRTTLKPILSELGARYGDLVDKIQSTQ